MKPTVQAYDVRPGMVLDLAGDQYADADRSPTLEIQCAEVESVDYETADCVVIDTSEGSFAFPVDHVLTLREISEAEIDDHLREIREAREAYFYLLTVLEKAVGVEFDTIGLEDDAVADCRAAELIQWIEQDTESAKSPEAV